MLAQRVVVPAGALEKLLHFGELVSVSNSAFGVCSAGDGTLVTQEHVPDCLSLAPYCADSPATHLDIGSGGGFPGLVLAIVLPQKPFQLIERSERKCSFLRLAMRQLELKNVAITCGTYPRDADFDYGTVTARAVERPESVGASIAKSMPAAATFLCQSARMLAAFTGGFHVEQVDDAWRAAKLRRSELWAIRRR